MNIKTGIFLFAVGVVFGVTALRIAFVMYPEDTVTYKQGQIDAVNGKINYELVKQPDGTSTWKRKQ